MAWHGLVLCSWPWRRGRRGPPCARAAGGGGLGRNFPEAAGPAGLRFKTLGQRGKVPARRSPSVFNERASCRPRRGAGRQAPICSAARRQFCPRARRAACAGAGWRRPRLFFPCAVRVLCVPFGFVVRPAAGRGSMAPPRPPATSQFGAFPDCSFNCDSIRVSDGIRRPPPRAGAAGRAPPPRRPRDPCLFSNSLASCFSSYSRSIAQLKKAEEVFPPACTPPPPLL